MNLIIYRFKELGYDVQIFALNSAHMNCPQARHRVFFIANRCGFKKLRLDFKEPIIPFGEVRSKDGIDFGKDGGVLKSLVEQAAPSDKTLADVTKRLTGEVNNYFTSQIIHDAAVCPTITSAGMFVRYSDRKLFSDEDFINVQTFPQDYNFKKQNVQYVCGMSVPPNMMANIAMEVWKQWLS